jgi:hypothetical protein
MIRFSTVAANADVLGEDTPLATDPDGDVAGRRRTQVVRRSDDRPEHRRGRHLKDGPARAGKDINAAGFLKDPDANKPS